MTVFSTSAARFTYGSASLPGCFIALALAGAAHAQTGNQELVAKGEYIFSVAAGCACHSDPKGTPHSGARRFSIPFGTVYSTNLTADKETGLAAGRTSRLPMRSPKGWVATG